MAYFSSLDCFYSDLIGNGFCNDEANTDECNYDGGDCCGTCVNSEFCSDCVCLGGLNKNGFPKALLINCHMTEFDVNLIGDENCNGDLNNKGINFLVQLILMSFNFNWTGEGWGGKLAKLAPLSTTDTSKRRSG